MTLTLFIETTKHQDDKNTASSLHSDNSISASDKVERNWITLKILLYL